MVKSIHLICRRHGSSLLGMSRWEGMQHGQRSCCWRISDEEAADLLGGWVYFHEAKGTPSRVGGQIVGFEPGDGDMEQRKAFLFTIDPAARGQRWRGASHHMAMSSGVVDGLLSHEVGLWLAQRASLERPASTS